MGKETDAGQHLCIVGLIALASQVSPPPSDLAGVADSAPTPPTVVTAPSGVAPAPWPLSYDAGRRGPGSPGFWPGPVGLPIVKKQVVLLFPQATFRPINHAIGQVHHGVMNRVHWIAPGEDLKAGAGDNRLVPGFTVVDDGAIAVVNAVVLIHPFDAHQGTHDVDLIGPDHSGFSPPAVDCQAYDIGV